MTRTDRDGKDAMLVAPKCSCTAERGTTATNWRYLRTVDQLSAAAHRNQHHTMYIVACYYWTGTLGRCRYSVSGLTAADSILRVIPFRSVDSLHPAGIDRLLMVLTVVMPQCAAAWENCRVVVKRSVRRRGSVPPLRYHSTLAVSQQRTRHQPKNCTWVV